MSHIYYILIGLLMLLVTIFIAPSVSVTEVAIGLINEFNNKTYYTSLLLIAILGASYFIGGTLTYCIYEKGNIK